MQVMEKHLVISHHLDFHGSRCPANTKAQQEGIEVLLPYTSKGYSKLVVTGYTWEQNFSFKGCIYLLTEEHNIRVIDVANASSTIERKGSAAKIKTQFYEVAVNINRPRWFSSIMYFVELSGAISLVCRLVNWKQLHDIEVFKVYKLDLCHLEWVKLDDLGDQILFVSSNCSRSFSAKDLGISIANCICFADGCKFPYHNEWEDVYRRLTPPKGSEIGDWGIFKLDNDSEIVTKVTLDELSAAHLLSNQKDYEGVIKLVNEAVKMSRNCTNLRFVEFLFKMKDKKISMDWSSDLPEGILEMISEKLSLSDYIPKSYGECVLSRGCVMGSFEEWLIMVKFHQCPFKISMINPLSGVEIHLPPVDENYRKLIFSKYPGDENCVYMLFTPLWTKLIFWTPGAQDWCEFEADQYYDVTTELYEVRVPHDLPIQDDDDISMPSRYLVELCGEIILVYRYLRRKHDCHSSIRFETYDFKICKLDLSKKAWVALDSLGDYVLFVSRNCSRSILAKELGLGMANCIYFTYEYDETLMHEWEFPQGREGSNQSDWGVFNINKNHSKSFCPIETTLNRWPSTWITVPLWWYFQKKIPFFYVKS
ncbi:hypothetical protein Pint_24244 [Pistacia integerrima]|uniref:Uncharacterized protein n=1 Tax=Pistacia integerrima TaxID=434235 RepID=A0ACC0YDG4_9ROSI|nr:hypothetical protein Pint_24244 [Pistacia integerrima]